MSCPQHPLGISSVGSFPVLYGGSLIIFQLFRCRILAIIRDVFPTLVAGLWGVVSIGGICTPPYILTPPVHLDTPHMSRCPHIFMSPFLTCTSACSPYTMGCPYVMGTLGASVHPTSWEHQYICQAFLLNVKGFMINVPLVQ